MKPWLTRDAAEVGCWNYWSRQKISVKFSTKSWLNIFLLRYIIYIITNPVEVCIVNKQFRTQSLQFTNFITNTANMSARRMSGVKGVTFPSNYMLLLYRIYIWAPLDLANKNKNINDKRRKIKQKFFFEFSFLRLARFAKFQFDIWLLSFPTDR